MIKKIEELIEKICTQNDYHKILLDVMKDKNKMDVRDVLIMISDNPQIDKKKKEELYEKIYEYTERLNVCFENKIKDVYLQGYKEACITTLVLRESSVDEDGNMDEELQECLNDFVRRRLKTENKLATNNKYQNILNAIQNSKTQNEGIDKLENLYSSKCDYENIDSYQVGFNDAIKISIQRNSNNFNKQ